MSLITAEEKTKYAEIFQARGQVNGYMSGSIARDVLLSSSLPPDRLEKIWDLSDIDKDGSLDFEEFCIAMHLTFECINGADTPTSLPPTLIPQSKVHLFPSGYISQQQAGMMPQQTGMMPQQTGMMPQQTGMMPQQTGYAQYQQPYATGYTQAPPPSGPVEFSWDMTPQDMTSYQNIYSKYANETGKVKFGLMDDFYRALGLSHADLSDAWSLVDVNHTYALTQDQCLTYFHILNQRTKGAPIPKQLPPDLQAAFAGEYAADLGERPGAGTGARKGNNQSMSKSAQLADSYVNRLGVASTSLSSKGTSVKGEKYDEEEMLKRELEVVRLQAKEAQKRALAMKEHGSNDFESRPLRDQFQALYDYKLRQLTDQADVADKVHKQSRDIDVGRDAIRRLDRLVEEARDKKRELEGLLEERRMEVVKTDRLLNEA
ncbi:cytoskeletal-regulatory complex EF hand-domain-containing protein [Phycomyces nitens]|nr:cytoskeletal-regulatory complex EF hand-domain-containing protein [Phycomyces nitens]